MKLNSTSLIISLLCIITIILFTTLFNSCEKESEKVMKVKIDSVYDISETSAKVTSTILDLGAGIEEHGHCWSKNPVLEYGDDDVEIKEEGKVTRVGAYNSNISGLEPETKYYIRAYIKNGNEIKHSERGPSFTTSSTPISLPVVTTDPAQNISVNEATVTGNIEDLGTGATSVSEHGHCWSTTNTLPTVNDYKTLLGAKTSTGVFMSTLESLSSGTTYYVRAYATNPAGTAYSNHISFTTPEDITVPTVTTAPVTEITHNSAVSGGNVISDGGAAVTARGVCWNTSPNPTLINSSTTDDTGTGDYTSNLTNLTSNTTYYVRAYATNSVGTAYGGQKSFTTAGEWNPGDDWVDKRDGQVYSTVQIGSQVWMAENLNVGTQITGINYPEANTIIEKYCYNDNSSNCDVYGGLYTWDEMMNYEYLESTQGICPDGWHLPSDLEWKEMESFLGVDAAELDIIGLRGTDEAYSLLVGGSTGFDALMAGYREYSLDAFYYADVYAYFWTTTEIDLYSPYYRLLHWNSGKIGRGWDYTYQATSVRCIKN